MENPLAPMALLEDRYDRVSTTSNGTCGEVFKGRDRQSGDIVAMKRIKTLHPDSGFPMNSMREIKILRDLRHPNIVHLRGVHTSRDQTSVYLVFDYCEYDLAALLIATSLTALQVRCYLRQIFLALCLLAEHQWIHRDLKPANILITPANIVKLADFGLAKKIEGAQPVGLTSEVVTIWYRPPELLMGCQDYGPEIDIWSAGCILYEMLTRNVLFQSVSNEAAQEIDAIFKIHGFPTPDVWQSWEHLPESAVFRRRQYETTVIFSDFLEARLPPQSDLAKDLLIRMLEYDSRKRISPTDVLKHPYVQENSEEIMPDRIPRLKFAEMHHQMPVIRRPRKTMQTTVRATRKRAPPPSGRI
jgi:serine/threonine protein kinase